jgi:hypothetical protein
VPNRNILHFTLLYVELKRHDSSCRSASAATAIRRGISGLNRKSVLLNENFVVLLVCFIVFRVLHLWLFRTFSLHSLPLSLDVVSAH